MSTALALIVGGWAVALAVAAVRSRQTSPRATVGGFERTMEALGNEGTSGRDDRREPSSVRPRENPLTAQRRTRFLRLLVATLVLLASAIWFGGLIWLPFAAVAATTVLYAAILRRAKVQRDEARRVVRELHLRPPDVYARSGAVPGAAAAGAEHLGDGWTSTSVRLRRWDA